MRMGELALCEVAQFIVDRTPQFLACQGIPASHRIKEPCNSTRRYIIHVDSPRSASWDDSALYRQGPPVAALPQLDRKSRQDRQSQALAIAMHVICVFFCVACGVLSYVAVAEAFTREPPQICWTA